MKVARVAVMAILAIAVAASASSCAPPLAEPSGAASEITPASIDVLAGASSTAEVVVPDNPFAPVEIDPSVPTATARIGDSVAFVIPEAEIADTAITTADTTIVEIVEASDAGGMLLPASGTVLAAGTATIVITSPDGTATEVVLTVTE